MIKYIEPSPRPRLQSGTRTRIVDHGTSADLSLSGKLGESSVANAATLSVATAVGGVTWGLSITNNYLVDDIVRKPIAVRDGCIHPIEEPGLGVDIDETKVARFELRPKSERHGCQGLEKTAPLRSLQND